MNVPSAPKITVIVPTCHRPDLLIRCLESLDPGYQEIDPTLYEVLVTDDGRKETSEGLIDSRFPFVRWSQGPARGPAANRNSGARAARGEWIAFIDDDCVASKNWIKSMLRLMGDGALDVIEGQTVIPDKIDNPFYHGVENTKGGCYWSCNLAFVRQRFLSIGGFDEDFPLAASEDMELAARFTRLKFQAKFCPEALVYHPLRPGTFVHIVRRVFLVRWFVLYQYKTRRGLNESESMLRNLVGGMSAEVISTMRRGWHTIKHFKFHRWKTSIFWVFFWFFATPIDLVCYAYWACYYHRVLNASGSATAGPRA